jgi:hypothetical protein
LGYQHQVYVPPGPIAAAFIDSTHPISIIMGPAGSGKTVASAYKPVHMASTFAPVCRDGVIRVKLTVLRDTYRQLAVTALESWHHERLFPIEHPWTTHYEGGQDRPVKHHLKWTTIRDKTFVPVELQAHFAAIGDANPEQFAKGYEPTYVWLNECDMLGARIPGLMFSRTGRYPALDQYTDQELSRVTQPLLKVMRASGMNVDQNEIVLPRLLWGDCNPPDYDNWVVKRMIDEPEKWPLYHLYRQPSGLAHNAENRVGKPRSAYEQDLANMTENDARRFVHGEPGYAQDGLPVYREDFALQTHRADAPLRVVPELPLALGIDAGGSPAMVVGQFMPNGQLRIYREICADAGTGPERFAMMAFELLLREFPNMPVREAFADPSSWYGADEKAGELAWIKIVAQALSLQVMPTESNEVTLRHEAVKFYLGRIDAHTPRMIVDPSCRMLIGGFAAHYKLTKQTTAGATDRLMVAKNEYSHVHDALQYLCYGHRGRMGVMTQAAQIGRAGNVVPMARVVQAKTGFDVHSIMRGR